LAGTTLGTANYLSPEQATGAPVSGASDIYSLGLVLLESLTGAVAYPGHGVEAAVSRLHRPPAIPDSVPDGWARLLRAMTERDPTARPTAADVGIAVTGLAAATDAPTDTPAAASASEAMTTVLIPASVPHETMPHQPDAWLAQPASSTRVLPAASGPPPAGTRSRRRLWALIAAALAAVVAAVIVAVTAGSDDAGPPPTPAYPTVPGQLGSDLRQLQQDVAP
jgi:serine/threonine protein kinase